jgi:hypothetical protein
MIVHDFGRSARSTFGAYGDDFDWGSLISDVIGAGAQIGTALINPGAVPSGVVTAPPVMQTPIYAPVKAGVSPLLLLGGAALLFVLLSKKG